MKALLVATIALLAISVTTNLYLLSQLKHQKNTPTPEIITTEGLEENVTPNDAPQEPKDIESKVPEIKEIIVDTLLFTDDMENKAVCIGEWNDIQLNIPADLNNNTKKLLLIITPARQQIKEFSLVYTSEPSRNYSHRWRVGEFGSSAELRAGEQYRYEVMAILNEGVRVKGINNHYITQQTEPFRVLDCGTKN